MRPGQLVSITLGSSLLWLGLMGACTVESSDGPEITIPEGPRFPHAVHVENGLECGDCHARENEEDDRLAIPAQDFCMDCHTDIDEGKAADKQASSFFPEGQEPAWKHVARQSPEIIFSHQRHEGAIEDCGACHGKIAESTYLDSSYGFTMATCMDCHTERKVKTDCATCHTEIREDRKPPTHDDFFRRNHGQVVAGLRGMDPLPADCAICHKDRTSCDDCHRDMPPTNHTNFWRIRGHAFETAMDRGSCQVCHGTTDFCLRCHEEVKPRDHFGAFAAPLNRHCIECHLPVRTSRCQTCHLDTPSHDMSPRLPGNAPHMTTNSADCRACHVPLPHLDNGDDCLLCHRR